MIASPGSATQSPFDLPMTRRAVRAIVGMSLLAAPIGLLSAQGQCGGARAGTPACDTSHVAAPFAPTGWKTVALDHFTMHAVDYKKEAAYYATLMNWKVRSDDGKQAVLDIGDIGTVVIVGGYEPPPPAPRPVAAPGDSTAGRGGRAGGAPRPAPQAVWDSYSWQISPWNAKKVEAELRKRGLNPIADNDGKGFESFHVKDPDGFDVQLSNGGFVKARKASAANAPLPAPAPFENTNWKTVWLDHISFGVSNYKESYVWYEALLGWKPTHDEGSQNETWICDDCGNILIRGGNPLNPAYNKSAPRRASMGHISFGISPFDADGTKAELDRRGLTARPDIGRPGDIHEPTALYKSYHTTTPMGFDLQISNATKANRTVR